MAQITLENSTANRKGYAIGTAVYYVEAGYGVIVDTTTISAIKIYPLITHETSPGTISNLSIGNLLSSQLISTAQVSIDSDKPYLIAPRRQGRVAITILNTSSVDIYLGNSDVSSTSGIALMGIQGNSMTISTQSELYAISANGPVQLGILEAF